MTVQRLNADGPIARIDGLIKRFADVTAVDRLSLSVYRGEIFGLVRPDGAGKTATMRMLAGVMRPDAGAIIIDGIDAVASTAKRARTASRCSSISRRRATL